MNILKTLLLLVGLVTVSSPVLAHHVLGRPAYSLNEDSNTPPSMQVEAQIGNYFVSYMVFPAFPRAGEPGRINLYATQIDTGEPFHGTIQFTVRDDSWFSSNQEILGVQNPDDSVHRQGFVFSKDGGYLIRAEFESSGEPYVIDFPLRIGQPSAVAPITMAVVLLLALCAP